MMQTQPMLTKALLIIVMFAMCASADANPERDYRKSIDKIGGQIKQISRNLNANEKLLKTEQDRLFETEKELQALDEKINKTNQVLQEKQLNIKNLDRELEKVKESQKDNRQALKRLLESRYKQGRQDYLKRFLNQDNPYAVGRLNNYHNYFTKALSAHFDKLKTQIKKTQAIHLEHQKEMSELVMVRDKQYTLQSDWQESQRKRAKSVQKLSDKVGASKEKLASLKKDRARLNTLLKKISEQAAELRRIEKERLERERREREKQQSQGKTPAPSATRVPVKGGFLKQKGRLLYPVNAKPKTKYGSRLRSSGMKSEGMFFDTNGSSPVKSVFRGRVLFADFLKGYGLLIIVDHGDNHISLYGHNELLYKRVGDTVETNEVIAKTGVTGGLKSPGLYFEIRQNASPVNPALWCK